MHSMQIMAISLKLTKRALIGFLLIPRTEKIFLFKRGKRKWQYLANSEASNNHLISAPFCFNLSSTCLCTASTSASVKVRSGAM